MESALTLDGGKSYPACFPRWQAVPARSPGGMVGPPACSEGSVIPLTLTDHGLSRADESDGVAVMEIGQGCDWPRYSSLEAGLL